MLSTVTAEEAAAETADVAPHDDDTDNHDAVGEVTNGCASGYKTVCRPPSFYPVVR